MTCIHDTPPLFLCLPYPSPKSIHLESAFPSSTVGCWSQPESISGSCPQFVVAVALQTIRSERSDTTIESTKPQQTPPIHSHVYIPPHTNSTQPCLRDQILHHVVPHLQSNIRRELVFRNESSKTRRRKELRIGRTRTVQNPLRQHLENFPTRILSLGKSVSALCFVPKAPIPSPPLRALASPEGGGRLRKRSIGYLCIVEALTERLDLRQIQTHDDEGATDRSLSKI